MNIILYVSEYPVLTKEQLDEYFSRAVRDAHDKDILSMVFLRSENGNELGITVGGDETILTFEKVNSNEPLIASKGITDFDEPYLTVYLNFIHHTEFPRRYVIPFSDGMKAAYEFLETDELPKCIEWMEG